MMNVADRILAAPHAIEPQALLQVLAVAERLGSIEAAKEQRERRAAKSADRDRVMLEAVATKPLESIGNLRYARARGPVAVLEISGPIYRYASMFDDISAISSVQRLAVEFQILLDNPTYHTIVLLVDSPGGEIDGIHQFAEMIFNARDKKRIVSYIDGDGCSAAYWLLAAASEVYIDKTARVGSIGVRMSMRDPKQARVGMYVIVDSEAPDKDPDPATSDGMAELRRQIEPLAAIFRESIATYRGIDESAIRALRGGARVGQYAVEAQLADGITAFETLMNDLMAGTASTKGTKAMKDEQLLAVLTQAEPEQSASLLEGLRMKAEYGPKIDGIQTTLETIGASQADLVKAIEALGASSEASASALEALGVHVKGQDERLAAMDERLKALEGEATATAPAGGYRASQSGDPPANPATATNTPQGFDPGIISFMLGGKGQQQ